MNNIRSRAEFRWWPKGKAGVTALVLAMLLTGAISKALAQDFPSKPMRWVLPYPPGAAPDTAARILIEPMALSLGKPVIVDNRSGGTGALAISELLRAPADGYTLLGVDNAHWGILPATRSDLSYNFTRDFMPVALIYTTPQFIVVRESLGVKNLREFIALVRSKPGVFQYGSTGTGSVSHLTFESFKASLGLNILHVPYKGGPEIVLGLLRGDVSMTAIGLITVLPHVKNHQLRLLASSGQTRFKLAPDVPTISEAGGPPNFDLSARFAMVALTGTPSSAIERVAAAMRQAQSIPDVDERALKAGVELTPAGPERLASIIAEDAKVYARVAKLVGLSVIP